MRAQLADSVKENKGCEAAYSVCGRTIPYSNSDITGTDRVMSASMLSSRPEEGMSGFSGNLLQELSRMHEQARQAMRSVAKALCPSASPPGKMEELLELFKGARRRFRFVEDTSLPGRCTRSLGHGENTVHQA